MILFGRLGVNLNLGLGENATFFSAARAGRYR